MIANYGFLCIFSKEMNWLSLFCSNVIENLADYLFRLVYLALYAVQFSHHCTIFPFFLKNHLMKACELLWEPLLQSFLVFIQGVDPHSHFIYFLVWIISLAFYRRCIVIIIGVWRVWFPFVRHIVSIDFYFSRRQDLMCCTTCHGYFLFRGFLYLTFFKVTFVNYNFFLIFDQERKVRH